MQRCFKTDDSGERRGGGVDSSALCNVFPLSSFFKFQTWRAWNYCVKFVSVIVLGISFKKHADLSTVEFKRVRETDIAVVNVIVL